MLLTPFVIAIGPYIATGLNKMNPLNRLLRVRPLAEIESDTELRDHVIIAGYGAAGQKLAKALGGIDGVVVSVEDDVSYIGSGSVPDQGLPSKVVRLASARHGSKAVTDALRLMLPSVFGRLQHEAVLLDVRTLLPGEVDLLADSVRTALEDLSS